MKHINIRARTPEGAILRLLEICQPEDIATAVDLFIARLDAAEGDPDLEPNGDELDGSHAEDDFCNHNLAYPGPGCPVSDGGCPTGSGAGDPAWAEWHTRGRFKVGQFGEEQCRRQDGINMAHEDDEDDDPDQCLAAEDDSARRICDGLPGDAFDTELNGDEHDIDEGAAGYCPTFGIDQTMLVAPEEAFHSLSGIPFIRVPHPANDQVPA